MESEQTLRQITTAALNILEHINAVSYTGVSLDDDAITIHGLVRAPDRTAMDGTNYTIIRVVRTPHNQLWDMTVRKHGFI